MESTRKGLTQTTRAWSDTGFQAYYFSSFCGSVCPAFWGDCGAPRTDSTLYSITLTKNNPAPQKREPGQGLPSTSATKMGLSTGSMPVIREASQAECTGFPW